MKICGLKLLLLAGVVAIVAGCKVAVIVVEGGEVQSTISGTCLAGTVCIHEVTDSSYTESFEAVSEAGWEFVKWNNGGDFLCGDQTDPICVVTTVGTGEVPTIQAIIASDKTYYIQPIFTRLPVSVVSASDGNEWAELNQFKGVSHSEIAAACPGGACSGLLNGYDMNGWSWATAAQVRVLMNGYSGGNCPTVPCLVSTSGNWVATAVADGFQPTFDAQGITFVHAYTSEPQPTAYAGLTSQAGNEQSCVAAQQNEANTCTANGVFSTSGGWFVK